jgi:hypothetical protein
MRLSTPILIRPLPSSSAIDLPRRWLVEMAIIIALMAVVILLLASVTTRWIVTPAVVPDQVFHLEVAQDMYQSGNLVTAHFLYHALVLGIYSITPAAGWTFSAAAANLLPQALSAALIYVALRMVFNASDWGRQHLWWTRAISGGLALGLVIAAPLIFIPEYFHIAFSPMLLGTVTPTTYHSPTTTTLRPLAFGLFLMVITFALKPQLSNKRVLNLAGVIALTALLTVVSSLAKPNYLLVLIPSLGLWVGLRWLLRRSNSWLVAILGVAIPGVLFLAWQYYFTYLNPTEALEGGGIIFAPFRVMWNLTQSRSSMLLLFAVSFVFPVTVYGLYWREARRDLPLNFAWLSLVISLGFMYLLAESGLRMDHGNFFWGAYIANWLLYFASVRLALKSWLAKEDGKLDWRSAVTLVVFLAHVISGLMFIDSTIQWQIAYMMR